MWWNKIHELEKRIERLEYREPSSLESFYKSNKYVKVDNLYWLDLEWFTNALARENCVLYKSGIAWNLCLHFGNKVHDLCHGFFVGEIYEGYLWYKDTLIPVEEQRKKKKIKS